MSQTSQSSNGARASGAGASVNDGSILRRRVFLAEDDVEMRRIVADAIRKEGHEVIEMPDGAELLLCLAHVCLDGQGPEETVDLLVTDIRMPGCNGLDVVELLRATDWRAPIIVMTAFGDRETRARAERIGAVLLDKPFRIEVLLQNVRKLLG
jgi:DNA-binding response OmpR family regulator